MHTHNTILPPEPAHKTNNCSHTFTPQWGWFLLSEQQPGEKRFSSLCWDSSRILNVLTGCGGLWVSWFVWWMRGVIKVVDGSSVIGFCQHHFDEMYVLCDFLHFLADNYGGYENQLFKGNDGGFLLSWAQKHKWQPVHDHQACDKYSTVNWIQSLWVNLGVMYDGKLYFWMSTVK